MEPLLIRIGTAADLPAVAALQAHTPESAAWPVEDYLAYRLDLAEVAGTLAGFLVTRQLVPGEAEVLNLVIAEGYRRRGVASTLIEAAVERWPGSWFLEVRASNHAAQACYHHLGFRKVGVRPGYYRTEDGNSSEEGIVMEKGK